MQNKHLSHEERIKALQKSYDESSIDVNVEEMFLEAEWEYAESHEKDVSSLSRVLKFL